MSTQQTPRTNELAIVIAYGPMDPECRDCGHLVDVQSIAAFADDFLCPPCADRRMPGMAQLVTGLTAVYDAVTFDLGPAGAPVAVEALGRLTDILGKVAGGELTILRGVEVTPDPYKPDEPCGVRVFRELRNPSPSVT